MHSIYMHEVSHQCESCHELLNYLVSCIFCLRAYTDMACYLCEFYHELLIFFHCRIFCRVTHILKNYYLSKINLTRGIIKSITCVVLLVMSQNNTCSPCGPHQNEHASKFIRIIIYVLLMLEFAEKHGK